MSSLSVHLRMPEDHSELPFHPSCPVCRRDRLAGSVSGDELVSRRTQAAIAAGLLAFSGVGAPAAVASGPDQEVEGSAEVVGGGDPGSHEIGETTVALEDEPALEPDDADVPSTFDEDDVALEPEAAETVEAPVPAANEVTVAPAPEPTPAAEPVAVVAPPPPAEPPAPTDAAEPPASEELRVDGGGPTKREQSRQSAPRIERRVVSAPAPAAPTTSPATTTTTTMDSEAPVAVEVLAGADTTTDGTGRASAADRFHLVRRGESLWSIASDLLGGDANVARVAREVSRLWALNEDRIATGSPDLLFAGTRLRLR